MEEEETKLNERQKAFCEEYVDCLNGTQSYEKAYKGCKYSTARTQAAKLLAKPDIQNYIKKLREQLKKDMNITAEFLVKKALNVYKKSMNEVPVKKFNFETKQMEETGEYYIDAKGANGALDLIAGITGLKQNRVEATIIDKPVLKDDI